MSRSRNQPLFAAHDAYMGSMGNPIRKPVMPEELEEDDEIEITVPQAAPAQRKCLMCTKPFESEGAHNRICRRCKASQTYRSA